MVYFVDFKITARPVNKMGAKTLEYIFFFLRNQTSPIKINWHIEPEALRGTHSKVPKQHYQANSNSFRGFSYTSILENIYAVTILGHQLTTLIEFVMRFWIAGMINRQFEFCICFVKYMNMRHLVFLLDG